MKKLRIKLEACRRRMRRLVRDFVVARYVSAGLQWGEAESYWFNGPCVGYDAMERRLEKWEARYARYGFIPVRRNTWIVAGGYGAAMEHELYVPNDEVQAIRTGAPADCKKTMETTPEIKQHGGSGSPGMPCYPSSFGPGCRVKVDSSSTYNGRYGTITEANGMPDRWFVAIDEDDRFAEVSFYARELIYIPEDNDKTHTPRP